MTKITDHKSFYAPTTLSEHISATPEGFLLCRDVVIARTGTQDYTPAEVPIEDNGSGIIAVARAEDEVFRAETMASFEGKPITLGHPAEFVNPRNWKAFAVGFTRNVRRGTGDAAGYLMADLLLTDEAAIAKVQNGLREVSCGYEADYTQDAPGQARQSNIYGNHVALVERCRCGGACSIKDEESTMKDTAWSRLLSVFGAADGGELETKLSSDKRTAPTLDEPEKPKAQATTDREAELMTKLEAVEQTVERIAAEWTAAKTAKPVPESHRGTADEAAAEKTADAKEALPAAEIIAPGIAVHDGEDAAALKRRALQSALNSDYRADIAPFLDGKSVEALAAPELSAAFTGAVRVIRHIRNTDSARSGMTPKVFSDAPTIDAINKANVEFWANNRSH
jgi:hypothetical protein